MDFVETYRTLRRRSLTTLLAPADVHAYVDARHNVSEQVLSFQRGQMLLPGQRQRKQARAKVHIPITLQLNEWETDTFVVDLSAGGCALFLSRDPGQEAIPFKLHLSKSLIVRGIADVVTVRERGSGHHVSLRFRHIGEEAEGAIEEVVLDALVGNAD